MALLKNTILTLNENLKLVVVDSKFDEYRGIFRFALRYQMKQRLSLQVWEEFAKLLKEPFLIGLKAELKFEQDSDCTIIMLESNMSNSS